MGFGRKFGRSTKVGKFNRKSRASLLGDAARTGVERLESRQLLSMSVFQPFNSGAASVTGNFVAGCSATQFGSYSTTGGIFDQGSAHGGGLATNGETSGVYNQGTTTLADGKLHVVSWMVKDSDTSTSNKPIQMGWTAGQTEGFYTESYCQFISARILGLNECQWQSEQMGSSVQTPGTTRTFSASATSGDWLQLNVAVQNTTTSGTYNAYYEVIDFGPNGTSAAPNVLLPYLTTPVSVVNNGFAGTSTTPFYAGYRSASNSPVLDDFAVDPNPSATTPNVPVASNPTSSSAGFTVTWAAATGANTYTVLRSTTSGSGFSTVATNIAGLSYSDPNVTVGTTYYYEIEGVSGLPLPNGTPTPTPVPTSAASTQVSGVAQAVVSGLAASSMDGSVHLSWTATPSATSYVVLSAPYNLATPNAVLSYSQLATPATNSYTDSSATDGNYYSYEVEAFIGTVQPASAPTVGFPAAVVDNFNTNDISTKFIIDHDSVYYTSGLQTSAPAQNFGYGAAVGIQDQPGPTNGGGLQTDNVDMNLNYQTQSVNIADGATTAFMFQEGATVGTARIGQLGFINILDSSFNSDNNSGTNFGEPNGTTVPSTAFIGIRPYGSGELEFQCKTPGGSSNVTSTALVPGTTPLVANHWYKLTLTVDETGSLSSNYNYIVTLDDYGTTGTALASNVDYVSGSTTVTGFDVTNGSGTDTAWAGIRQAGTDAPNIDNFVLSGTAAAANTHAPVLNSPIPNNNAVYLSWPTVQGATSYTILRGTSMGVDTSIATGVAGGIGTTTYTDTTAMNGTTYYYEVEALQGASTSLPSNEVSAVPSASDAPPQVTGLTATPGSSSVVLNWTAAPFATGYNVYRANGLNQTSGGVLVGTTSGNGATTFTDNAGDLISSAPGEPNTYSYYVAATEGALTGTQSATANANFFNGAEDWVYNTAFWNSSANAYSGYTAVGVDGASGPTAMQNLTTANVSGAAGASPVVSNATFPNVNFSQVITGKVVVTSTDLGGAASAPVTFGVISDDGSALYVAGNLVESDPVYSNTAIAFNNATGNGGSTSTGGTMTPLTLTAGQSYDFELLETQGTGAWQSTLEWSTPATQAAATPPQTSASFATPDTFVIVPQASLIELTGAPTAPSVLTTSSTPTAGHVPLTWTNNADNELEEVVQTASSATGPWTTVATLQSNNVNGTISGSTTSGSDTDGSYNATAPIYYRVGSRNFDGTSYSNVLTIDGPPSSATSSASIMPSTIAAGAPATVTVTVEDSAGDVLAGDSVSLTLPGGNPETSFDAGYSGAVATGADGTVTFSGLTLHTAGAYTLDANVGSISLPVNFSVVAGTPASVAFVQGPSTETAGSPMTPAVTVEATDAYGNPVTGDAISLTLPSGPESAFDAGYSGAVATGANGVATFSGLTLNTAGAYTLSAGDGTISTPTPAAFSVVSSLPSWLSDPGGHDTWTGGTLTVNDPSTIIADPGADEPKIVDTTGDTLYVNPSTPDVDIHVGGITLANSSEVDVVSVGMGRTHDNHNVLVIGALNALNDPTVSVSANSKIDLEDNDLIVHTGTNDTTGEAELATIQALAATGRNVAPGGVFDGTWDGNGLTSSTAASVDASLSYEQNILGVTLNSDMFLGGPDQNNTTWTVGNATENLGANDILVKYTYNGDLNLEGAVNGDAATVFSSFFISNSGSPANDYAFGDLNGDGVIDGNDATIFSSFFGNGDPTNNAGNGLPQL